MLPCGAKGLLTVCTSTGCVSLSVGQFYRAFPCVPMYRGDNSHFNFAYGPASLYEA
jgi:hypothetical protein